MPSGELTKYEPSYEGEWEDCLSTQIIKEARINITAGCQEWTDYLFRFDEEKNYKLFKDCAFGSFYLQNKKLIVRHDADAVKLVDKSYECDVEEIEIDYDYFNF